MQLSPIPDEDRSPCPPVKSLNVFNNLKYYFITLGAKLENIVFQLGQHVYSNWFLPSRAIG